MTWQLLEGVLRNYAEWKSGWENGEVSDELTLDGGIVVNLHEILEGLDSLPPRQREAIVLICLLNYREVDAARKMGLMKWSSQVGSYKRIGLRKIVDRYYPQEVVVDYPTEASGDLRTSDAS